MVQSQFIVQTNLNMKPKLVSPAKARFRPLTTFHVIPKQPKIVEIGEGYTLRTTLSGESLKAVVSHIQEREGIEVKKKRKGGGKVSLTKMLLELI